MLTLVTERGFPGLMYFKYPLSAASGDSSPKGSLGMRPPLSYFTHTQPKPTGFYKKEDNSMASNRIGRINEEIQRELASLIPNV